MTTQAAKDTSEETERRYKAPALEKGLDILELLAKEGEPLTTSQIANRLGRSVSELFRMVLTLEDRGYILQERGREGYGLSNKLFSLGLAQTNIRNLIELALQEMKTLTEQIGQSCHLTVTSNEQIVVVARVESPRDLGFSVRIGYRRPIVESTSGAVLCAYLDDKLKKTTLQQLASGTHEGVMEAFMDRVKQATDKGYVQCASDFVEGVTDISAPIRGGTGVVAALTVPHVRCRPEKISVVDSIDYLREATGKISELLQAEGR